MQQVITYMCEQTYIIYTKVSVWGFLPFLYVVIIIGGLIGVRQLDFDRSKNIMKKSSSSKRDSFTEMIIYASNFMSGILHYFVLYSMGLLFVIVTSYLLNEAFTMNDRSIEFLFSFETTIITLLITLSIALLVFDKREYLVYNIKDVMNHYGYYKLLCLMLLFFLSSALSFFLVQNMNKQSDVYTILYYNLETSLAVSFIISLVEIHIVLKILFGNDKTERKLLKKIHRVFWSLDDFRMKDSSNWDTIVSQKQFKFLVKNYKEKCLYQGMQTIKNIEYVNFGHKLDLELVKIMKIKSGMLTIILLITSTIFGFISNPQGFLAVLPINALFSIFLIWFAFSNKIESNFIIFKLFSGNEGYVITTIKKRDYIHLTAVISKKKYREYINSLNNLIGFLYIENYVKSGKNNTIHDSVNILSNELAEDQEVTSYMAFIPVLLAGYFAYTSGDMICEIRDKYHRLLSLGYSENDLDRSISSQIYYMTRNSGEKTMHSQIAIGNYFNWLHGCG